MQREKSVVERSYHLLCLALGRLLRSARYSAVRVVEEGGARRVHKRRLIHAPLLVRMGAPLVRVMDTGVRVLGQREWEERERRLYEVLYGISIGIEEGGTLVLPCLPGETLATLLEETALDEGVRWRAVELAVRALSDLHRAGVTHGDAMAENVLVDLDAGVARWIDFETVHEPGRPIPWRRADDLRTLLATCAVRTAPAALQETVRLVLDTYRDEDVARLLVGLFGSALRRPLAFHLAQAPLPFRLVGRIAALLRARD